jgi:hypothetical protein
MELVEIIMIRDVIRGEGMEATGRSTLAWAVGF